MKTKLGKSDEEVANCPKCGCDAIFAAYVGCAFCKPFVLSALRREDQKFEIELTRGKKTLVSPEDFYFLSQWKWYCTDKGRAARGVSVNKKSVTLYMHRVIADRMGLEGQLADHENRDKLDNRRCNIRPCSKTQNNCNRGKVVTPKTKSRFKGVCGRKKGKWAATIAINGKKTWIGTFADEESAARAYDEAARNLHGSFAFQNFPDVREARQQESRSFSDETPTPQAAEYARRHADIKALLNEAAECLSDCETAPPNETWWKRYFIIDGAYMILTDEGWESGDAKKEYEKQASEDGLPLSDFIKDEVNAP